MLDCCEMFAFAAEGDSSLHQRHVDNHPCCGAPGERTGAKKADRSQDSRDGCGRCVCSIGLLGAIPSPSARQTTSPLPLQRAGSPGSMSAFLAPRPLPSALVFRANAHSPPPGNVRLHLRACVLLT
jgi:hypothetical protein